MQVTCHWQRRVSCMRQGMLTLCGAPSTTSRFGYFTSVLFELLHLFHISLFGMSSWLMHDDFYLMRNIYIIHAYGLYIYIFQWFCSNALGLHRGFAPVQSPANSKLRVSELYIAKTCEMGFITDFGGTEKEGFWTPSDVCDILHHEMWPIPTKLKISH